MGALRLPSRLTPAPGSGFLEVLIFGAVAVLGLGMAVSVGDQSPLPMIAIGAGSLLMGWMAFSARYEVTLGVYAVYLMLADGFVKLHFGGNLALLGRDLLLLAITTGALARWATTRHDSRLPPLTWCVVAWVGVLFVEIANPANGTLRHSLFALRPHLEFVPLFFLGYAVMRSPGHLRGFLWLLIALAAVNGVVGYIQSTMSPSELAGWGQGYADKIYGIKGGVSARGFLDNTGELRTRPFALGSDMGFGGALGVLAAPSALAIFALIKHRSLLVAAIPFAAGTVLAVVTSQARIAILGALAGVGIYVLFGSVARRSLATMGAVLVSGIITWLVVSALAGGPNTGVFDRYGSIAPNRVVSTAVDYRKDTVATIPQYLVQFPLGAGLGTVGPGGSTPGHNGRRLNGESEFTFLIIEAGIAGLLVMLAFNLRIMHMLWTRVRRIADPDVRLMLAAIGAPMIAKFFSWFGGASTAGTPDAPYMWFVGGILVWWLTRGPVEGTTLRGT
jgi:hypothetical protein